MPRKNRKQKNQVEETEVEEMEEDTGDNVFTYIGGGESSPRVIHFMGLQKFVRGRPTEVTNPLVLAKLSKGTHPTIIKGTLDDEEELHEMDEEATKAADKQRAEDKETQRIAAKENAKWAGKGE